MEDHTSIHRHCFVYPEAVDIRRPDPDVFVFQYLSVKLSVGINDEDFIKFRGTGRMWLSSPVSFGHKVIQLFEAILTLGNGDIQTPVPVAQLHSRKAVQPSCPAFPDKVQRSGTVVDVRQYRCVMAVCYHTFDQLPEAECAVAQAVIAM